MWVANEDYCEHYKLPPSPTASKWWDIQVTWGNPTIDERYTFFLISATYKGKKGFNIVSAANPKNGIRCGEFCCVLEERAPAKDESFFINLLPSTFSPGHYFVVFPEKGKALDGCRQTNLSLSATPLSQTGGFAGAFSWSFTPYHYNLSMWPTSTSAVPGGRFSLQWEDLFIGSATNEPLAPGTKLIVTPYLPRHGMEYNIEPANEEKPGHFRFVSMENPKLYLCAEGLEEDTNVTLTDKVH